MNERIRELAIQVMHSDPEPHLSTELFCFTTSEFEKFAELIVRECMNLVNDCYEDPVSGQSQYQTACASTIIEDYFGVEE